MTGILIITAIVVLLVLALEPAHRRAGTRWRPGLDTLPDRDLARSVAELRAVAQRLCTNGTARPRTEHRRFL